ncbi:MerR family transcriptional regulator [Amycolatopsis arida]|uniref:MerR family transcriptional regulator n=1 Tax=Amycolatopsis arida TaxID=587909 RepID=UPI000B8302A2|nr:MerR family transcriptional regulator [Amycolatopsis arida]
MGRAHRRAQRPSGVSIPTIKFYLREQLLAPGRLEAPNQAHYDREHLHQLRLIRALIDVGGLSVAATGDVLDGASGPDRDPVTTATPTPDHRRRMRYSRLSTNSSIESWS